jgi:PPOX class probable F420-dependent enzyme
MIELDPLAHQILGSPTIAHLATLMPDGSPHSVPLWLSIEGDHLAVLTSPDSRKGRNMAADARVAVSAVDLQNPAALVSVRGRVAEVVDGEPGWEIIDRISELYTGGAYPLRTDRVAYLIKPDHVFAIDLAAG